MGVNGNSLYERPKTDWESAVSGIAVFILH